MLCPPLTHTSSGRSSWQEVDLKGANKDGSALLASEGLQEFAVAAGLWGGDSDAPFNFFRAFASDTAVDASANCEWQHRGASGLRIGCLHASRAPAHAPCLLCPLATPPADPRVRAVQALLGGYNHTAADAFAPVFLPPAKPLQLGDVMAGLRLRYNGTTRDPYAQQTPAAPLLDGTPGEPWRPVALLTTGLAHGAWHWQPQCWGKQPLVRRFQLVNGMTQPRFPLPSVPRTCCSHAHAAAVRRPAPWPVGRPLPVVWHACLDAVCAHLQGPAAGSAAVGPHERRLRLRRHDHALLEVSQAVRPPL